MAPSVARRDPIAYYPVLLGLAWLAEQYPTTLAERQHDLVVAAEGLIAQNSGFNPIYEGLLGVGVLIFSIVMVQGVFPRWVGYLGVVTGIAAITPCPAPDPRARYLLWWLFFVLWFIAVAWYLVRLARSAEPPGARG